VIPFLKPENFRVLRRFTDKIEFYPKTGCWLWMGAIKGNGYGWFRSNKDRRIPPVFVHRFAYTFFIGSIPDGCVVDHVCCIKDCCNPRHLQAISQSENVTRSLQSPSGKDENLSPF